ncbi:hypothetical protein HYH02_005742 [Chlamydomonas schloesseri]|uniref:AMP-dependent synthetase/ligase domain-containing protein n=1 Tax=Chlamydomonas schloesseri TaxID=2026947 RepID=A0A836B6M4_9CHLO|nr:hypothetical protein HYH02_005742 [Chlamydomonas schloesseri]|eukprot:KAG2448988.1 hypothetical protein HYH02_005742 [Chlamydomonas schloesseri]
MMEAMLACLDAGCIVCPVNWRWSAAELAEVLQRLSPTLVLHDAECAALAQQALAQAACVLQLQPQKQNQTGGSVSRGAAVSTGTAPTLCLIDHWSHATSAGTGLALGGCRSSTLPTTAAASGSSAAAPPTTSLLLRLAASGPQHQHDKQPPAPTTPPLQLLAPACGTALLVFTSGTTAAPKGVQLGHAAFHAQSLVKLALVGYSPADTYLHTAPLFHIGGLSSAFAALMAGCVQVFMPRFDAAAAMAAILRHRVSVFIAVPTMLQDLALAAAAAAEGTGPGASVAPESLKCVQRILVGAGGTAPKLQEAVSRTFPAAHLLSAYGMTEACSSMTFRHLRGPSHVAAGAAAGSCQLAQQLQLWAPPASSQAHGSGNCHAKPQAELEGAVCVGWPAPGVQVRVVRTAVADQQPQLQDEASPHGGNNSGDRVCAPYQLGEVQTRGPHTLLRYWRDAAATAEALTADGWLRTGDLGYLGPDGGLWLLGRAKDMIKSGGENVFAPQVEAMLCAHPAVAAAAVVGLPHERLGEQVSALVVLRGGWNYLGPTITAPSSAGGPTIKPATAALPVGPPGSPITPATAAIGPHLSGAQQTSLQDLQDFCRRHGLAGFRLPRVVVAQWQPLPLNGSGKVAKPMVRTMLQRATGVGMSRL